MFHEVRIVDAKKHLKKTISSKELSRRHWTEFVEYQKNFASPRKSKTKSTLQ